MSTPAIEINPRRSALLEGHANECLALLRIKAPAAPASSARRKPLNLALVIDRSGSMSGAPLQEAKRCAAMIIDRLGPEDHAALVVYDNRVNTIMPARAVSDRASFHRALAEVESGGSTALFDGWLEGAAQAAVAVEGDFLSRVLLLSDGCANQGLQDVTAIEGHCREMAATGVSTSTCGLGRDFNEELMVAMAAAGQGQSYYGETAEDLLDPFTEEFDLMRALCARKLHLQIETPRGIKVRVMNDYPRASNDAWLLPDLAFGGEVWALVSVTVPARMCTPGATIENLLTARVGYTDLGSGTSGTCSATLTLGTLPAAAYETLAGDERVAARSRELRAAELQLEAREAARRGDWDKVDRVLRKAEKEAADNPWVEQSLQALRRHADARRTEEFSKEAIYKSRRMHTRQAAADESVASYSQAVEMERPAFLRRKIEQGKRMGNKEDST